MDSSILKRKQELFDRLDREGELLLAAIRGEDDGEIVGLQQKRQETVQEIRALDAEIANLLAPGRPADPGLRRLRESIERALARNRAIEQEIRERIRGLCGERRRLDVVRAYGRVGGLASRGGAQRV